MSAQLPHPRPAATVILLRRGSRHAKRGLEVLLARRTDAARFMPGVWVFPGGALDATELDGPSSDDAHRACAVRELAEEAGLELADDAELLPWSRWVTPEHVPVRFDTRFYVALAPPHSSPEPDGGEITDVAWMEPKRALERHRAGELELVFPTVKNLESLLAHSTAEEALAAARERVVEPILPKVVAEADGWRVVLPGEPGYAS